ncbi:MAG: tetratricopeptide repeat protein [Desulfatibacillum sp.]|nr:tetratricopeptide repeat protein [Desulfatibacillum sp.]
MTLSNKKQKFIIRNHESLPVEEIAAQLRISPGEVDKEIKRLSGEKDRISLAPGPILDKISFGLLGLLVILIPFAIRQNLFDITNLPQTVFALSGSLALVGLLFARTCFGDTALFLPRATFLPMALLAAWAGLSMAWAPNHYESLITWTPLAACLVFFVAAVNILDSKKRWVWLLKALFFSGFAVALLGVMQHLFEVDWVKQAVPPASTFANRNMAVHFIVLTLPLGAAFFLRERKGLIGAIYLACATLMLNYLFYTSNRTGWICLFFQLIVFASMALWFGWRPNFSWSPGREKRIAMGACLVLFLVLFNMTPDGPEWQFGKVFHRVRVAAQQAADSAAKPLDEITETASKNSSQKAADTSLELRIHIWLNSLEMIKEHPWLGVGVGNHKVLYPIYSRRVVVEKVFSEDFQLSNVHNDYIQAAAELGLIGLALAAWLALATFLALRRILLHGGGQDKFLVLALATALAGIMLNAAASFPFQRMVPLLVVTAYLAVISVLDRNEGRKSSFAFKLPARVSVAGGFVCLVLLVLSLWAGHRAMEGDRHFKRLEAAEARSAWDRAIQEANLVLANDPYRLKACSYLGRAYLEKQMPDQAIPALEKVVQVYPYHMNALLNLGVAYASGKDYDKALEVYERVLKIKPDYAKVHNNLGNIFMEMENPQKAFESFTKASELDPVNPIIWMNQGVAATHMKAYEKAAKAFVIAARLDPKWVRANRNAGYMLQHTGKMKEGAKYLGKAEELEQAGQKAGVQHN